MQSNLVALEVSSDIVHMLKEYVEYGSLDWYEYNETLVKLLEPLADQLVRNYSEDGKEITSDEVKEKVTQQKLEYWILDYFVNVRDKVSYNTLKDYLFKLLTKQNKSLADTYYYYDQALKFLQGFGFITYDKTYLVFNLCNKGKETFERVTNGELKGPDSNYYEKMYERWVI